MKSWTWAALGTAALLCGAAHAAPVYGDADGNGTVTVQDAAAIAKVAAGLASPNATLRHNGDVAPVNDYNGGSFGDGRITLLDAISVARKANGIAPNPYPAKPSFYLLEIGNTLTYREYNADGTPATGPGTGLPDTVETVDHSQTDTGPSGSYLVYVVKGSDGAEQHIGNAMDGQGNPELIVTRGTIGGTSTAFDPPLVVLKGPVQPGTTWIGTTNTTISGYATSPSYTGTIAAAPALDVPKGAPTMHFDNALKVTIAYSGTVSPFGFPVSYNGTETYYFVPFVGPIQYSYFRQLPFQPSQTQDPDISLVAANVHGVLYP